MSKYIKFPSHVTPDLVSVNIARVDKVLSSPNTNIQQVASRGNAAWHLSYQYTDLSQDEAEVVRAFLADCEGSVAAFHVPFPANYRDVSGFTDIYSSHGEFGPDALNSWWVVGTINHSVTSRRTIVSRWKNRAFVDKPSLRWGGHSGAGNVDSLEIGYSYVQRAKYLGGNQSHMISFYVGSSGHISHGPLGLCSSADIISVPFTADETSYLISQREWNDIGRSDDQWEMADFWLSRCALVSNSENLLTYAAVFSGTNWALGRAGLISSFDTSPFIGGSWKFFANTSVNTSHTVLQNTVKVNSEDIYTVSVYARAGESDLLRLDINHGAQQVAGIFQLSSGTSKIDVSDSDYAFTRIFPVGSGWYRCQVTARVNSDNDVGAQMLLLDGTFASPDATFTGNGSDGVEIYGAQLRKFPHCGQYVETSSQAIVSSSNPQTGRSLTVDGLNPSLSDSGSSPLFRAGHPVEVITRYHDRNSGVFHRSEICRLTRDIVPTEEGWATLSIDPGIRNAPETSLQINLSTAESPGTVHNAVLFSNPQLRCRIVAGTIQTNEKPLQATDVVFEVLEDLAQL